MASISALQHVAVHARQELPHTTSVTRRSRRIHVSALRPEIDLTRNSDLLRRLSDHQLEMLGLEQDTIGAILLVQKSVGRIFCDFADEGPEEFQIF